MRRHEELLFFIKRGSLGSEWGTVLLLKEDQTMFRRLLVILSVLLAQSLIVLFVGSSTSNAAFLIVPSNEQESFSKQERRKIVAVMKKALKLRSSEIAFSREITAEAKAFFQMPETTFLRQSLEAEKILSFEILQVPDTLFDLWFVRSYLRKQKFYYGKMLADFEKACRRFYFKEGPNLYRYLKGKSSTEALDGILSTFAEDGFGSSHSRLVREIRKSRDLFLEVLKLEEDAILNHHYLFWRGTNGIKVDEKWFLDFPLKARCLPDEMCHISFDEPKALNLSSLMAPNFSFGRTLLGGALHDGFERSKPASSFAFYGTGYGALYLLSIPREKYAEFRHVFYAGYSIPEYDVFSGGELFHARIKAVSDGYRVDQSHMYTKIAKEPVQILRYARDVAEVLSKYSKILSVDEQMGSAKQLQENHEILVKFLDGQLRYHSEK